MDSEENNKRKRGKQSDEDDARREKKSKKDDEDNSRKEKKSRRARSKSKSPLPRDRTSKRRRKHSRSRSPEASHSVKLENEQDNSAIAEPKPPERKRKETDMLNTKTGGAYIPPARLRMMQAQITDKTSVAYQRLAWEALKKSVHGHINKINIGNIGIIIKELLKENIVRGRGLLCRSVIQAQAASPTFTNVYAALVAAVNSRFPNIGELLLKRLVIQFKRGFKRNDKPICISSASFIAHLVNQRVAHEILALELLTLLVESPTDDSVEVAISFLKECGQKLTEVSSKGVNAIFEMLRNILHEGQLDKRVQYMIEVMFQVWKDGFKDHPALIEDLELVPEEEQFTHLLMLDDATDPQDILNVFKFDDKYEENEQKYKTLSKEILGSDAESGEEDGSGESGSEESDEEEEEETEKKGGVTIIDNTETNLVALRRTIYLTINSSLDFEECAHKLMKMQLKPGQEVELCHMFLDCCAEQRTYEKFYGLLAQRFCNINRIYIGPFEEIFKDSYSTAHRLDTNRLRNVSKFFAHLLFTDSISWEVMDCVKLNEEDTTSSSRIYIKILFQELAEYMGLKKLNDRLKDPTLQQAFSGVFPRDNPKNTRFSINFFTSIGLGGLTDELREHLKQMPKNVPPPITEINVESESSSDSSSSSPSSEDSSSDSSSSDSDEETTKKKKKDKTSGEKSRGEKNNEAEEANKDTERWGHDGFYDTYGKDARRTEVRPDRNNVERNLDYARSDKDNTRLKQTERDRENSRSERNRYERRDRDNSRSSQSERDNSRSNHSERDNSRTDRYERNRESSRVDKERYRSRSDRVERDRADFKSERDKDNFAIPRQVPRNDKYRESNRANDEENQQRDHRRGYDNEEQSTRKRDDESSHGKERRKNYERNDSKCQGHKESDDDKYIKRNNEETRSKRDKENRYVEAVDGPKDRGRKKHDSSNEEDNKSDEKYNKKSKDKKKKKDKESRSSDDDSKSRKKHKKKAKENNSRKNREKDDSSDDDSSSSSDDSRRTPPIDQTGWDIRRESSITKEIHGRYWDSHKFDDKPKGKTERNKSPEKTYYGNRR